MERISDSIASRRVLASRYTDAEIAQMDASDRQADAQRRLDRLIREAGDRYSEYTFARWMTGGDARKETVLAAAKEYVATWPERLAAREGLLLMGPCGAGKDHLGFAVAAAIILMHHAHVGWINGERLYARARDGMDSGESELARMRELCAPNLLIITDALPVTGRLGEWQARLLYLLIESRYAGGKLCAVLANAESDSDGRERFGAPTWDRIRDRAWVLRMQWSSYRRPARVV